MTLANVVGDEADFHSFFSSADPIHCRICLEAKQTQWAAATSLHAQLLPGRTHSTRIGASYIDATAGLILSPGSLLHWARRLFGVRRVTQGHARELRSESACGVWIR